MVERDRGDINATHGGAGWSEGGHAELLSDITRRHLDPARPDRWIWDPRPDRSNAGEYRERRRGEGTECPFLAAPLPLLEAHAFWTERALPDAGRSILGRALGWLRAEKAKSPASATASARWRLLIVPRGRGLRWRWWRESATEQNMGQT